MLDQFRSDQRIARVTVPLLVMHGTSDPAIPIALGERLFALAHAPKQFVRFPGGGHENLDDFGAIETARSFINAAQSGGP
jgi:pimeloyl-ACP methyl ester carboxylesterase